MTRSFSPSRQTLRRNLLIDFQPMFVGLIVGPVIVHFANWSDWRRWGTFIASGIMCLLSLHLYMQTRTVYRTTVLLDNEGLTLDGPFAMVAVRWSSMQSAVLFRRPSPFLGERRMLRIDSSNAEVRTRHGGVGRYEYPIYCHVSAFSSADEASILETVGSHVRIKSAASSEALS